MCDSKSYLKEALKSKKGDYICLCVWQFEEEEVVAFLKLILYLAGFSGQTQNCKCLD